MAILLFSCNNEPAKDETKATDTSATTAAPVTETKPAFVPFKIATIQQKVKNFEKSEKEYFSKDSLLRSYGITHYMIGRDLRDSNIVFVIDKIEDLEKARTFFKLATDQAAMKKDGDARRDDLSNAKQGIQSLARIYPDFGGEKWKPLFEGLLKDIQRDENNLPKKTGS